MFESQENDRLFNNADSFAMVFDEAWRKALKDQNFTNLPTIERTKFVLNQIQDHPFIKSSPEEAKKVAQFRIRLLKLD